MTALSSKRLDPVALGFAVATLWSITVAALGLTSQVGYGQRWRTLLAEIYPGFEPDEGGLGAGIVWGSLDGLFVGVVLGWLSNLFRR
ncbi:bacteriophage holin [Halostagnicola sp. A-GB9-2]|uniref:bacteriophage holin n=1 Tax=Halostagnicola sp. A-GB9-2 TaxID=3048066 RepID=UPI0024BF9640|nr:bacteriophage holin [Halostagnicola sp. A-GB9-2]MDJ1432723.1 bacteriophage holin [Halostagnicola sp. A-GB9-2]